MQFVYITSHIWTNLPKRKRNFWPFYGILAVSASFLELFCYFLLTIFLSLHHFSKNIKIEHTQRAMWGKNKYNCMPWNLITVTRRVYNCCQGPGNNIIYKKYITNYITARELEQENDEKISRIAKLIPLYIYFFRINAWFFSFLHLKWKSARFLPKYSFIPTTLHTMKVTKLQ